MAVADPEAPADVAIVGAGPVGMKLALDLAEAGVRVLLLESGADRFDPETQSLSDAEIVGGAHAPMNLSVRRAFGGTSALWGGRAVAFDELDFTERDAAPLARWPITKADVAPWEASASAFLDIGPPVFDEPWPGRADEIDGLRLTALERWCAQPNLGKVHPRRLASAPNIRIARGATVLRVVLDGADAAGLETSLDGARTMIRARAYVIAAGGVETARLLLASRRDAPSAFGGPEGPLGRFYMGHIFGSIADIRFQERSADKLFDFHKDAAGRYVRRRFALSEKAQRELRLLNLAAWPELPDLFDPRHESAILSLAYLALAAPLLGPRLMAPAIRMRKLGSGPARILPHLWNTIRGAPAAAAFAAGFLAARYADKVRLPGFFVRNSSHLYPLHYHAEQSPQADSRITLCDDCDRLGMPRARIDVRLAPSDADSIVKTHDAIAERLTRAGIARLEHRHPPERRAQAVLDQAADGFHQIGTARMAADPRHGVVDADLRVHGAANLFVAGSAVFPSSSQANPTFLAVALAARLADHLRKELACLPS